VGFTYRRAICPPSHTLYRFCVSVKQFVLILHEPSVTIGLFADKS